MGNFRKADLGDMEEIIKICADVFYCYPLYEILKDKLRKEEYYRNFLYAYWRMYVYLSAEFHSVYVFERNNEIAATVFIVQPGDGHPGLKDFFAVRGYELFKFFSLSSILKSSLYLIRMSDGNIRTNECHIAVLAVKADCQRRNIGTNIILNEVVPMTKRKGISVITLNTNTKENLAFYEKIGFEKTKEKNIQWGKKNVKKFRMEYKIPLLSPES